MSEPIIITLIAALPGLCAAYFAYKQSTKAAEATSKNQVLKVEAGAYERARKLYEDGIRQLEEQVQRLRQQLTDERDVSDKMRNRINAMEETIAMLRRQLINAGVELAPEPEHTQ